MAQTRPGTDDREGKERRIVMGRVSGIFGVKGWLKVMSYTQPHENILNYNPWQLGIRDTWCESRLLEGRKHNKGLVVALAGVEDRDSARAYIGAEIAVWRNQLQPLPRGQYYQADLIGLQVINTTGKTLGQVKEIMETGANDVLVIEGEGRYLVPLVIPAYVREIDQDAGIITVAWDTAD